MKRTLIIGSLLAVLTGVVLAQITRTKAPEGASVYILSPKNNDTVGRTFTVQFGLKGMGVAPAGVNHPNTGHHHLLIDTAQVPNMSLPLPASDTVRHFGGGQTEVDLTLTPGKHTLQLVFADYLHIPHEKPIVSEKITVTVK
jgi:hypothetical protein